MINKPDPVEFKFVLALRQGALANQKELFKISFPGLLACGKPDSSTSRASGITGTMRWHKSFPTKS
jgi:hypothetical protein